MRMLEVWTIENPAHWDNKMFSVKTGFHYAKVSFKTSFTVFSTKKYI